MANRFNGLRAASAAQNTPEAAKPQEVIKTRAIPASAPAPQQSEQETRRRGRPNGKRSSDQFRQVTAYISTDNYKRTKMKLLQNDDRQEFSELVDQLLAKWLEE